MRRRRSMRGHTGARARAAPRPVLRIPAKDGATRRTPLSSRRRSTSRPNCSRTTRLSSCRRTRQARRRKRRLAPRKRGTRKTFETASWPPPLRLRPDSRTDDLGDPASRITCGVSARSPGIVDMALNVAASALIPRERRFRLFRARCDAIAIAMASRAPPHGTQRARDARIVADRSNHDMRRLESVEHGALSWTTL
ncbi:hypothetical protein SAMN05421548_106142 [Paraburkholderia lycopersici]|uniref:Uncharacterized protein n=1 Tax=Paraburkholderia lycopersici TaxID=416944 RepID=A0A1G6L938_9BURK|nr:hypothetical protein SAMN05421548_106142 [Paraburkholderia lycopersici]